MADAKNSQSFFVQNGTKRYFRFETKKTFIYKMKQIQVKNYGNTAKMVVIKIGMGIAICFCKRIDD